MLIEVILRDYMGNIIERQYFPLRDIDGHAIFFLEHGQKDEELEQTLQYIKIEPSYAPRYD